MMDAQRFNPYSNHVLVIVIRVGFLGISNPVTFQLSAVRNTYMAGFGHGPAQPVAAEDPRVASRNARQGMRLFLIYLVFYAGFVGLNAFAPRQMESTPLFGVNLAILYGCGLIVAAMVLSLVYCWQCRGNQVLPPTGT